MITELDLTKLLNTALEACRKCADVKDAAEEGRAVDALRVLAQQQVTAELLSKTEAGKRLKKLSKHSSSRVAEAASAAVEAWKECIRQEQAGKAGSNPSNNNTNSRQDSQGGSAAAGAAAAAAAPSAAASQDTSNISGGGGGGRSSASGLETAPSNKLVLEPARTGDETRDKIRKLIAEALGMALSEDMFGDPCAVAVEVENALFVQNGGVNAKYKAKFRSLSFNLKDPKNPDLRQKVLLGDIPGDVLVNLSAEELASKEMRAKNDQIREHMKNESVRGQSNQASTDMFQCGKCKQRKCTYYQLQTRSADEPMTTFVTCTNCGNRWKFC